MNDHDNFDPFVSGKLSKPKYAKPEVCDKHCTLYRFPEQCAASSCSLPERRTRDKKEKRK